MSPQTQSHAGPRFTGAKSTSRTPIPKPDPGVISPPPKLSFDPDLPGSNPPVCVNKPQTSALIPTQSTPPDSVQKTPPTSIQDLEALHNWIQIWKFPFMTLL